MATITGVNIYIDGVKHNVSPKPLSYTGYIISNVKAEGETFDVQFSYVYDDGYESELTAIQTYSLLSTIIEEGINNTYTVALSGVGQTRNDNSNIIRLANGNLGIAYGRFPGGVGDENLSSVYVSISTDEGATWGEGTELIATTDNGSPSLYRKSNGDILCFFFVREEESATSGTPNSSLRQIVFDGNLSQEITPMTTILSEIDFPDTRSYFPVAPDRFFYDSVTDKLYMPYLKLISGPGASMFSRYYGRMLVSSNEGGTWTDTGLVITGEVNADNEGGAMEPGIIRKGSDLLYYYRTIFGYIGYALLDNNVSILSEGELLPAANAMSDVKFVHAINKYVAVYTKLVNGDVNDRTILELSTSDDGLIYTPVLEIANAITEGKFKVNEPGIYINGGKLLVPYSISNNSLNEYDLKILEIPLGNLVTGTSLSIQSIIADGDTIFTEDIVVEYNVNNAASLVCDSILEGDTITTEDLTIKWHIEN